MKIKDISNSIGFDDGMDDDDPDVSESSLNGGLTFMSISNFIEERIELCKEAKLILDGWSAINEIRTNESVIVSAVPGTPKGRRIIKISGNYEVVKRLENILRGKC